MFKILVIHSDHSPAPVAEVRTDGRNLEWVVDNTDGQLSQSIGNNLHALYAMVQRSSHLRIEPMKEATIGLHRYMLDNGDTVEMTTDGKTCILNGQILTAPEKDALFAALSRGEIRVAQKADISRPIPLPRASVHPEKPEFKTGGPKFDKKTVDAIVKAQQDDEADHYDDSVANDTSIEKINTDGQDPLQAMMSKNMLYYAKYGQFKGGVDA